MKSTSWRDARPIQVWTEQGRERVARQVPLIKHWQIIEGDYSAAPDMVATWFIDPPYQVAGKMYPCGADALDYRELGAWCQLRLGQVMVCENAGADWLPFREFADLRSAGCKNTKEVIWP